jgi:phosphopantetheinyl transferase (holo-ACP synthase)
MIGNDIVDLLEAKLKSNWKRPGYLDKLFTINEQQFIQNSDHKFLMVWRLWSMKEAAYKLYTQIHPSRFYKPKQFQCEINNSEGKVRYNRFSCAVKTKITSQYIISEARLVAKDMSSECIELSDSSAQYQSDAVKNALLTKIASQYTILKTDLKLLKSEFGIPSVYQNSKKLNISISISHHGNYGAYVFE